MNHVKPSRLFSKKSMNNAIEVLEEIVDKWKPKRVLFDKDATFFLVGKIASDTRMLHENITSRIGREIAKETLRVQLFGQKIAPGKFLKRYSQSNFAKRLLLDTMAFINHEKLWEYMTRRSNTMHMKYCKLVCAGITPRNANANAMINNIKIKPKHEWFKCIVPKAFDVPQLIAAYNFYGNLLIFWEEDLCILDSAAADYILRSATAFVNSSLYFDNYRVFGEDVKNDYWRLWSNCKEYLSKYLNGGPYNEFLATHMHLAYNVYVNKTCEEMARLQLNVEARGTILEAEMKEVYPYNSEWLELVGSFGITEREKPDFLKLYHLILSTDIDQKQLHEEIFKKSSEGLHSDPDWVKKCINFSKSFHFCAYVLSKIEDPSLEQVEGYNFKDSKWYKALKKGA